MLLQRHDYEVETNVSTTSQFRIGQSAAMFDALAGLYSNPHEAAVREVCTNALEAGFFRVGMPSALEPTLTIQDDGPSMSHEFMMDGYCIAGHSTKNSDENAVGGFGLGRLAPLAVTGTDDKYVVTCTQAGARRTYAVYRDSNGIPTIAYLGEHPTNEGDGTTIRIPVRRDDFDKVEAAVQKVLRWFPAGSFEIFGATIDPVKVHLDTPSYMQLAEALRDNFVLVGPIAYRVEWSQIDKDLPKTLVPRFKVGQVDLPPSREALKYTNRTLQALRDAYDIIAADIVPQTLRRAVDMDPIARLAMVENLRGSQGMKDLFDAYHIKAGHRAKDAAAKKAHKGQLYDFKPKWGDFLLHEHERVTIPTDGYSRYDKPRRYADLVISPKAAHHSGDLVLSHVHQLKRSAFFVRDKPDLKRVADRINASGVTGFQVYYVIDADPNLPDLNVFNLSDFEPPAASKKRYAMKHWCADVDEQYLYSRDGELPDAGVWMPTDGQGYPLLSNAYDLLRCPWGVKTKVYGFHKTAQAKVDLTKFVRLDDHLVQQANHILPAAADALAAAAFLKEFRHPLMAFVQSDHGELLAQPYQALQQVRQVAAAISSDAHATLQTLERIGLIKFPKSKMKFSLQRVFDRAAKKNPALLMMCEHGQMRWSSIPSEQLKEILK